MVDNFDIRVGCGPTGAADRLAGSKMAVGGAQWGAGAASYWPEGGQLGLLLAGKFAARPPIGCRLGGTGRGSELRPFVRHSRPGSGAVFTRKRQLLRDKVDKNYEF